MSLTKIQDVSARLPRLAAVAVGCVVGPLHAGIDGPSDGKRVGGAPPIVQTKARG